MHNMLMAASWQGCSLDCSNAVDTCVMHNMLMATSWQGRSLNGSTAADTRVIRQKALLHGTPWHTAYAYQLRLGWPAPCIMDHISSALAHPTSEDAAGQQVLQDGRQLLCVRTSIQGGRLPGLQACSVLLQGL